MASAIPRPDERSDARERALYLLYEAHSKGIAPSDALALQVGLSVVGVADAADAELLGLITGGLAVAARLA